MKGLQLHLWPHAQCRHPSQTRELVIVRVHAVCTAGTAKIDGLDIRTDMADIYAMMGVCPQHDLLWETLTGREHLLFYGRLKSLKV